MSVVRLAVLLALTLGAATVADPLRVHRDAVVVDLHVDTLLDLAAGKRTLDGGGRQADAVPSARAGEEIAAAGRAGKIAAVLSVENLGDALQGEIEQVDRLYREGVRLASLTWNPANLLADGARGTRPGGPSPPGRRPAPRRPPPAARPPPPPPPPRPSTPIGAT